MCACVCVCVCVRARVHVRVCVCVRQNPSCTSLQCLVGSKIFVTGQHNWSTVPFMWCFVLISQYPHKGIVVSTIVVLQALSVFL